MAIESIKRVFLKKTGETSWYTIDTRGRQYAASYEEFVEAAKEMNQDSFARKETRTLIINTWHR